MKKKLSAIILKAAQSACQDGTLSSADFPDIEIEVPRIKEHGDFSTNFAMLSASVQKMAPRKIATAILENINQEKEKHPDHLISDVQLAGPGFINFFVNKSAWLPTLVEIDKQRELFGACDLGGGQKLQVEFVSANPTGPLHVGHGRGAVVGDALARILSFCGWQVAKEYYINDAGNQITTLGRSVFWRWQELVGLSETEAAFPEDCYQGDYIKEIAQDMEQEYGQELRQKNKIEAISLCAKTAAARILGGIEQDLSQFEVKIDSWFSEKSLFASDGVKEALEFVKSKALSYEKDGAVWFKSVDLGDEKDRVMVRSNGETTYFASDIAYHKNKFDRGFTHLINVWGADHHGYVPRLKAAVSSLGQKPEALDIILVQLVNLLRDGQPVSMSTRSGEFVTLAEVVTEVGVDAARFIFLSRHHDSPLDFDLELAKQKNNENPVYYVQYVHARISSIRRKAEQEYQLKDIAADEAALARLVEPEEINLIKSLARYPEVILLAAQTMEPHRLTFYLLELAASFHSYYNRHKVLTADAQLSLGRLFLISCVRQIIRNGLSLLGVSAPESM